MRVIKNLTLFIETCVKSILLTTQLSKKKLC